jgi:lysyl-tRNA synthetase class 2
MKIKSLIPLILGRIAFLAGLFNIFSNSLHHASSRVAQLTGYLPVFIHSTAFATQTFTGVAMVILGSGLIRRKRRAWVLSLIIFTINIASDLLRSSRHPAQIIVAGLFICALIIFRKEFYAISDPQTKWLPLIGFFLAFFTMFCIGLLILLNRHRSSFVGNPSIWNIVITVVEGFFGISGPIEFINQRTSDYVETTLAALGFFILLIPLALYFRRVKPLPKMSEEDIETVRRLIRHDTDQDSLGYFATRRDKSVIWASNKKAGIAYRVQSGVMLASGDPFGEYSLWPEAIDAFLAEAKLYAWTPAVMGASDRGGEVWVEHAGMTAFEIGDEAIIKVKDFTLEGRPMANVRQMVNRIKRKGYSAYSTKWADLDPKIRIELRGLAKKWRYGAPERGFSMSMDRFGEDIDGETIITIAMLGDEIKGLLYFVPWANDGISLDRMQRERGTDPGVNELLIVQSVEWARENKIEEISLNFAAFRSLFERAEKISAGPVTRGSRNLIRFFSNFFQVESLYRFNAKFNPEWQTRYLVYPKTTDIAKIGWAAIKAEQFIGSFRSHAVKGN